MTIFENATQYAENELNRRRLRNFEIDEKNKQLLLEKIPSLEQLNRDISLLGISSIKQGVLGNLTEKKATEAEKQKLVSKRQQLIDTVDLDKSVKSPHYHCVLCKDLGMVEQKTCSCYKQLIGSFNRKKISNNSSLSLCSFKDFSLSYYSEKIDPQIEISPRSLMESNLETCRSFAENFYLKNSQNLLMLGNAGLGKTHLALSIANSVIEKGFDCIYCNASTILKQIEQEYFDRGHNTDTLKQLCSTELLILDDLGTEFNNAFITGTLYEIINTRLNRKLSTIITTNILDDSLFAVRYGEKISSRLVGCYTTLPFVGNDIRLIKNDM